jgi:hypothetical protein
MVDTRHPSFHLEAFQQFGNHSASKPREKCYLYWEALKQITPPYDLTQHHQTDLTLLGDPEKQEQLAFNKESYWYLDPISLVPKKEITDAIGVGDFDNERIKKYYKDEEDNLILQDYWDMNSQQSYKFALWEDPMYSEHFMSFQPFHGLDLIKFLDLAKGESYGITRDETGLDNRSDYKPSLEDLDSVYGENYEWEGREHNRFFFPIQHSETGELLIKEEWR